MAERQGFTPPSFIINHDGLLIQLDNTLQNLYPITKTSKFVIYTIFREDRPDAEPRTKILYAASSGMGKNYISLSGLENVIRDKETKIYAHEDALHLNIWSVVGQFRIQRSDETYRENTPVEETFFEYLKLKIKDLKNT